MKSLVFHKSHSMRVIEVLKPQQKLCFVLNNLNCSQDFEAIKVRLCLTFFILLMIE